MNNIENRIVEMKFDNTQFEAAVAKTMETLDRFKEKLNFSDAGKGMDQLGKATGNYQYTLNDIGQSLDLLNGRFSTMGTIGRRVLENLTDSAYNFAKNGIGKLVSSVTQGGLSRAMNLEQAKFQMQGIYKDAEKVYDVIYNDILPELQGTPFSLDQAAVVIGQLGASGIQASEDVRQATRAIAGLAAMSGRGFDEVGRIFSKVAGQGNMMGGELQQLSTYGINAAANIADYFKKVAAGEAKASDAVKEHVAEIIDAYGDLEEGTIRDAASKRMIYYEDMASAMDTLYGEHAKKSTEMFSGALDDLKAALARIGAEPAAIGLEVLRDAFNALVPAVDAVNAVLKPFTSAAKGVVTLADGEKAFGGSVAGTLSKEVQDLGHSFANLFVRMDENGKVLRWNEENIKRFATTLTDAEGVVHHFAVSGQEIAEGDAIMNPQMWRIITASTQTFVNVMKALRNVIEPVAKGVAGAFPKLTLTTLVKITEAVRDFTSHLILSEENMDRLRWITQGVFTPIGLVFRGLVGLVKSFVKVMSAVFNVVSPALNAIFAFAGSIGQLVAGFGDFIVDLVGTGAAIANFILTLVGGIAQFLKLDKLLGLIQTGFTKLASLFDLAGAKLNGMIGNAIPKFKEFVSSIGELVHAKEIAGYIKTLFENIGNSISKALHLKQVSDAFRKFTDALKSLFETDNLFSKLVDNLKNFIQFLSELIPYETIVEKISGAFDKLAISVGKFTKKPAGAIKQFFIDRANDIKEFVKNLDQGNAFERLARSMIKPYNSIKTWMTNLKVIILPLIENLVSYIPKLFGFVTFGEMMANIGHKIASAAKQFSTFIGILSDLSQTQSEKKLASLRKGLQNFFGLTLTEKILAFNSSLSEAGSTIGEKLVALGKSVGEALRNMDEKTVRKLISTLALLALAWKYLGVMRSAKATLDGFAAAIGGFGKLLGSFSSAFGLKQINTAIAKSIRMISLATSLMIFAGAVYILSKMDWKQVLIGSAVMLAALFVFWKIMRAMDLLEATVKNTATVMTLAVYMAGIGAGVLMMAVAVKQIANVWKSTDPGLALAAVLSVIVLMTAFAGVSSILGSIPGEAKSLGKASFALIGIAQGMKVMAEAFAEFGKLDATSFAQGLEAAIVLMGMFSLFALSVRAGARVFSAATGMMAIAASMFLMQKALAKFGEMDPAVLEQGGLTIGTILVALMGFAGIAGAATKSVLAASIGMIAIAAAIHIIGSAIASIGGLDQRQFENGTAAIVAMLAAFVLFAKFAGGTGALGGAAAILMLAAGIHLLTNALQELAEFNFGLLLNGLIKMVVVAAGLAVSIAVLNGALKLIGPQDAAKVALLGAGLFLLGNAIGVLAAVPIASLAIAIIGLVAALAAAGLVMGLFSSISPGLIAVGAAFALLGVAALFVGAGLLFLTMAITALVPLLLVLATVDMGTLTQGLQVIKVIAGGLSDAFITLAKGVAIFGLACLAAGVGLAAIGIGLLLIAVSCIAASVGVALLAGALALLAITVQKFFGGGLLSAISESFEVFTSGFNGLLGKLWDKIIGTSGTKAKETRTAIDNGLLDGSSNGQVQESLEEEPKLALANIEGMGPDFEEGSTNLKEMMAQGWSTGDTPFDLTEYSNQFGIDLDSLGVDGYNGTFDISKQMSKGLDSGKTNTDASTKKLTGSISSILGSVDGKTPGLKTAQGVAAGENSGVGSVSSATRNVEAAARPSSQYGTAYSVGSGICDGLVAGIKSGMSIVAQIAWQVGNDAANKAKQGAGVNSPSKKTIPVGEGICEGLILGINRMSGAVANAAYNLGDETASYVSDAMTSMARAFDSDMDFTPTITPVVDLTNVRQGVTSINSMFSDSSFGLTTPYSNYAAVQAAALGMREASDEFDAITKLAKEIGLMTDTMNSRQMINNINIEGSEDPNAFADALTRRFKLNARTM